MKKISKQMITSEVTSVESNSVSASVTFSEETQGEISCLISIQYFSKMKHSIDKRL